MRHTAAARAPEDAPPPRRRTTARDPGAPAEDATAAEPADCWCCGVPAPCRCERSGRCEECGWCRDHCRCFREGTR